MNKPHVAYDEHEAMGHFLESDDALICICGENTITTNAFHKAADFFRDHCLREEARPTQEYEKFLEGIGEISQSEIKNRFYLDDNKYVSMSDRSHDYRWADRLNFGWKIWQKAGGF